MADPSAILDYMPVGFRFRPSDEELVGHYLKNKLMGENFLVQIIPEIELCRNEPWDLPAFSIIRSNDPEWFFFSPPDFKYSNSNRANRATERGYWKATGKDRKIKVRGTDNVIGTKKTLVFYQGRVPNGVKTNWVIHEYHAVTFPVAQRTFVLCRLMKKPEKNAEGRTGELVSDEGEPRSNMASDYENPVFPLPGPAETPDFSPLLQANEFDLPLGQSPILSEQELSIQVPLLNSFAGNDNSSAPRPFETTEEEVMFVNSLLVDDDVLFSEEMRHALVNDSPPSEPLRMVYYESSDTDAEIFSARYGNIPDISKVSNKNAGSREYKIVTMVGSSLDAERVATSQRSSNQEGSREKKGISFQDDFWGVDTSSGDSTPVRSCFEISSSPTLKACRTQYQPRSANSVSQRAETRRSPTQKKVLTKAASHHEAQKDTIKESNNNQRNAQHTISRNTSEALSNQFSDVSGRSSFIHLETPALSQNLSPRSVYIVNVVIGFALFIVIIWDILSCGRFY